MILEKNNARSRDGWKVFKVAVSEFMQYVTEKGDYEKARYELYTGNWKECIIVFD